jgi:hypothetical protein
MNAILAACGLVAVYILISLLRVVFFPRQPPPPLVYTPKQVMVARYAFSWRSTQPS